MCKELFCFFWNSIGVLYGVLEGWIKFVFSKFVNCFLSFVSFKGDI